MINLPGTQEYIHMDRRDRSQIFDRIMLELIDLDEKAHPALAKLLKVHGHIIFLLSRWEDARADMNFMWAQYNAAQIEAVMLRMEVINEPHDLQSL